MPAPDPGGQGIRRHVEPHDDAGGPQTASSLRVEHRAACDGDDRPHRGRERGVERARSSARNAGLPLAAKIAGTLCPVRRSTSASLSRKGRRILSATMRPTVDLPDPIIPDQHHVLTHPRSPGHRLVTPPP